MNAGRRICMPAAFLTLALFATGEFANGQDREPHKLWQSNLTPQQLKAALQRVGGGGENLDPFRDQILDLMKGMQGKKLDQKDIAKALKLLEQHPDLLKQAQQLAKERQSDPGRRGKLVPDDLGKLFQIQPGAPFRIPDPKTFQPPKLDPSQPAVVPPEPGGKIERPPPDKGVQPPPDGGNPMGGPEQPVTEKKLTLDENPFPAPQNTNPRTKSLEAFAAVWERNIGPLSEMPEVQRALFELVGDNGFDFDIKDDKGNSFWDMLKNGDGTDFGNFLGGTESGGNWFGDWEWPKFNNWWGGTSSSSSSSSWSQWRWGSSERSSGSGSSGSGSGWGGADVGAAWVPFVILLIIIIAIVIWFQLKKLEGWNSVGAVSGDRLGAWPVDPRRINTREDVVKAFEYLSVLLCGPAARNWTHGTIAGALSDLAATQGETTVMLARLYELARYAPLEEPLTDDELAEARKLVCDLAGVPN